MDINFLTENPIFSIKLGQRLPKSFSQLHVKNPRFFRSYFLKKDDWPKAADSPLQSQEIITLANYATTTSGSEPELGFHYKI